MDEPVTRRCRRPNRDGARRHEHGRREGERRHAARAEAGEHDERGTEDRGAHRNTVRRPEERRRPACSHQECEGARDRLPRRREQGDSKREREDAGENELSHRHMHPRVEGEMGAVEVGEAGVEPCPQGGERVHEPEARARVGQSPGNEVDAHCDPRRGHGRGHGAGDAQRAAARCGGGEGEREEREHPPHGAERLLEAQPRRGDDHERRRGDRGRPGDPTHARPPPVSLLRERPRGPRHAAQRRSARPPPAAAGAPARDGTDVPRSSRTRRERERPPGE